MHTGLLSRPPRTAAVQVWQHLSSVNGSESSACLICLGAIRPSEAVWSCRQGCYAVLHMTCMQVGGALARSRRH